MGTSYGRILDMNFLLMIRRPRMYLIACWISLFLLGANLVIDILVIPLNFRLEVHTAEVASAYALKLFTTFFKVETWFLNGLIFAFILGPKPSKLIIWDWVRYLVTLGFLFYLVYQRNIILPEFIQAVGKGDITSLHSTMSSFEKYKVLLLLFSAFLGHFSYQRYSKIMD